MTALLPIVSQAQATARYYFNDNFSAGIGLTFAGDTDSFGINARYEF